MGRGDSDLVHVSPSSVLNVHNLLDHSSAVVRPDSEFILQELNQGSASAQRDSSCTVGSFPWWLFTRVNVCEAFS